MICMYILCNGVFVVNMFTTTWFNLLIKVASVPPSPHQWASPIWSSPVHPQHGQGNNSQRWSNIKKAHVSCHVDHEGGGGVDTFRKIMGNAAGCTQVGLKLALTANPECLGLANAKNPNAKNRCRLDLLKPSENKSAVPEQPVPGPLGPGVRAACCGSHALRAKSIWSLQQSQHFYAPVPWERQLLLQNRQEPV